MSVVSDEKALSVEPTKCPQMSPISFHLFTSAGQWQQASSLHKEQCRMKAHWWPQTATSQRLRGTKRGQVSALPSFLSCRLGSSQHPTVSFGDLPVPHFLKDKLDKQSLS